MRNENIRKTVLLTFLLTFLLAAAGAAMAQHETAFDVVGGQQAYMQVCANCHGPDGNLIANVDLGHGVFRQPYSDEQLVGIIKNGIPNTPMQVSSLRGSPITNARVFATSNFFNGS